MGVPPDFAGYVTGFVPPDEAARADVRARLGIGADERLCVVTVGGSGVGRALLHPVRVNLLLRDFIRRVAGA